MLGIIIGVASVIAIVTVGNGGRDYIVGMIRDMGNSAISLNVRGSAADDEDYFTDADIEAIKKIDGVQYASMQTMAMCGMSANDRDGFMMGIGGYVKGTMSMDFNGAINNPAYFTTSAIPINPQPGNDKLMQFNANQSSLFYNLVSLSDNKTKFGAYINMNFSGSGYTPEIQDAYVTYGGLLFGRTTSLFTDAAAIPPTIDSEGPNGLTYKTNDVINFRSQMGKHFSAGIGLEMPSTDFSVSHEQRVTNQYIPDIPSYLQYAWGANNSSHIRLSSMIRNVNYRNVTQDKNDIISTYACQLSGLVTVKQKLVFYYQLTYGSGVTTYIQDVSGLKLDFVPRIENNRKDKDEAGKLEHVNSMAYYAGLQYNFTQRAFMSCTFSQVDVDLPDNYEDTSLYKEGYYFLRCRRGRTKCRKQSHAHTWRSRHGRSRSQTQRSKRP